jgi:hypothetical protein
MNLISARPHHDTFGVADAMPVASGDLLAYLLADGLSDNPAFR